jgi:hypothetical protein
MKDGKKEKEKNFQEKNNERKDAGEKIEGDMG